MEWTWTREKSPVWDAPKARVIGAAPEGTFVIPWQEGDALPGDWFAATDDAGTVVGYGRLDTTWGGDAEILLAVHPDAQGKGVGGFVLGKLEDEAAKRGINYIHNTIREEDPLRDQVHDWLVVRGFVGTIDTDLRKRVGSCPSTSHRQQPAPAEIYDAAADPGGRPPGHEESGGYVNVDEHRY